MTERSELEVRLDQLCAGQIEQRADHKHLDECVDRLRAQINRLQIFIVGLIVETLVVGVPLLLKTFA